MSIVIFDKFLKLTYSLSDSKPNIILINNIIANVTTQVANKNVNIFFIL